MPKRETTKDADPMLRATGNGRQTNSKGQPPIPPRSDNGHRERIIEAPQSSTQDGFRFRNEHQPPQKKPPNRNKKHKAGSRAKHRLRSISRDVQAMEDLFRQHRKNPLNLDSYDVLNIDHNPDRHHTWHLSQDSNGHGLVTHALQHWKVVPNERCGSWYVAPSNNEAGDDSCSNNSNNNNRKLHASSSKSFCYFKSTDGHCNVWDFSLKRLNLHLLEQTIVVDGGCILVDSSVRKLLPDSFSKTVPIWATVLNTIVLKYREIAANKDENETASDGREDSGTKTTKQKSWDTNLHTPRGVVSKKEHDRIASLIEDRVEILFRSGAIVNPSRLVEKLTKPLRVFWMNHEGELISSNGDEESDNDDNDNDNGNTTFGNSPRRPTTETLKGLLEQYFVVVCWNPSRYKYARVGLSRCEQIGTANGKTPKQFPSSNPQQDNLISVEKHQTEWITDDSDDNSNVHDNGEDTSNGEAKGVSSGYYYTPGAADDHESWANQLTPALFWENQEALLDTAMDDDKIDALIDVLVAQEREAEQQEEQQQQQRQQRLGDESEEGCVVRNRVAMESVYSYSDKIGETNLWIGSRRASRPPECWSGFDAILNVTNQEYDGMLESMEHQNTEDSTAQITRTKKDHRFYLQLPVEEGKRDRTQLEHWMPVGLAFLIHHLQEGRRVLVHCAQGKDRSVAVALVFVSMVCPLKFPLALKPAFATLSWDLSTLGDTLRDGASGRCDDSEDPDDTTEETIYASTKDETQSYLASGLPNAIVQQLLRAVGKELFLLWIHHHLRGDESDDNLKGRPRCLADKEGVRITLHLIKQDREVAEPTRSTMQKIHRFLMSSPIYR